MVPSPAPLPPPPPTPFSICERITPRLAHANAAVVLSAVKVLMRFMELMPADSEFVTGITKKLSPPLVTLLSSEPEVSGGRGQGRGEGSG